MMLHSAIHWLRRLTLLMLQSGLWPFNMRSSCTITCRIRQQGLSPVDIFTKSRWQQHKFRDINVWGCPVYVLHKTIADGKMLPRWAPRSIRCANMGFSSIHASTVPLVLNPATVYITAQFHAVFDDWFSTISTNINNLADFNSNAWAKLSGESSYQYPFNEDNETDIQIDADPASDAAIVDTLQVVDSVASAIDKAHPTTPLPVTPPPITSFPTIPTPLDRSPAPHPISSTRKTHDTVIDTINSTPVSNVDSLVRSPSLPMTPQQLPFSDLETPHPPTPSPPQPPLPPPAPMSSAREPSSNDMSSTREQPSASASPIRPPARLPAPRHTPRRSSCQRKEAPFCLGYNGQQGAGYCVDPSAWIFQECGFQGPPLAFKAFLSDPATLSYDEAMSDEPNLSKWMTAAAKEIKSLE